MPMIAMSPEGAGSLAVVDMVTGSNGFDRVIMHPIVVSDICILPPPGREYNLSLISRYIRHISRVIRKDTGGCLEIFGQKKGCNVEVLKVYVYEHIHSILLTLISGHARKFHSNLMTAELKMKGNMTVVAIRMAGSG